MCINFIKVSIYALVFLPLTVIASEYGEHEHQQILGIYHDCQKKHYTPQECRLAMQSNVSIKIPPFVLCNLLNECGK